MSGQRRTISQRSELTYDIHEFGINIDSREIFLHGYVDSMTEDGDEPGVDYRMASYFIKNLSLLRSEVTCGAKKDDPILIHMLTCGGDWNFGMSIFDAIHACPCHITLLAYSHSRSMSSIIPQAADHRVIMPHCDFLIHWGEWGVYGNYTSVNAEMKWGEVLTEEMLNVYVESCREGDFWKRHNLKTDKEIREYLRREITMRQEYYMTAREAVDMGFYDAVFGDEGHETINELRKV
jgi:ATP-dependent protease ClpP protease subunit